MIFDTHLTVVPVLLIEGSGIYFPKVWGPRPLSPGNGRTYTTGMWDSTAMLVRRLRWFLPLCLALAACAPAAGPADLGQAATPFSGPPRALVVDSDMDGDSLMALLYLLQRPDLDLLAITVSGTGLTHCAAGVANALGLVALVGHAPIPVACGSETTLGEGHTSSPDWRAAADAGYGLALPEGGKPAAGTAVEVLTAVLGAAPAPVLVLTLGPLLFGVDLLRRKPLPQGNALPLLLGLVLFTTPWLRDTVQAALFGLGWGVLGYVLWRPARLAPGHPSLVAQ